MRKPGTAYGDYAAGVNRGRPELNELMKRLCLLISIVLTILLAGRLFWLIGRIVWLSGSAVSEDLGFYQEGVRKRSSQVQALLVRFHLEKNIQLDTEHLGNYCISGIKFIAEFLSQHVFYTVTQVSLTTIFVLFLLFSPVQRDLSPVMQGVFGSMELYLKLKAFISLMMGITNGIALAVIGLEVPAAWGLLTFLANFIPNIGGPVVSLVPCVISILDARKTLSQVFAAFMAQFFLHFNIANFVEPVIFGTTEEIHSVVVLLGLSFFGYIWGFTGMFLSVPLLFAMHAWLDTVVRTQSYQQEAREDARFIMGMLEGRWLADSAQDVGEKGNQNDVNLLTGNIEEADEEGRPIEMPPSRDQDRSLSGPVQATHSTDSKQQPMIESDLFRDMKDMLAVRDPTTGEVRAVALLLRWIFLTGMFTFIFFGFSIFHWHLHYLIHPSGGAAKTNATHEATDPGNTLIKHTEVLSTSHAHTEGAGFLFTTTVVSTVAEVENSSALPSFPLNGTAMPSFPFRGSPELHSGVSHHDAKGLHVGTLHTHIDSFDDIASSGSESESSIVSKTNRSSSDESLNETSSIDSTAEDKASEMKTRRLFL